MLSLAPRFVSAAAHAASLAASVAAWSAVVLPGLVLMFAVARPAAADPRWWWSDVRVTNGRTDAVQPHIITPGYATGGAGTPIFIVWAEVDLVQLDYEIWAIASFDQGCTFCQPTKITNNSVQDGLARIAVLALPTGFWSFAIIFENDSGEAVIAWDSTTVSYRVPADEQCAQFERLGPAIIAGDQYVRFGGPNARAFYPDISAVGTPAFGHFHATWDESGVGTSSIRYAHDLTARGGLGWSIDPPKTLPPMSALAESVRSPRIAADLATDPDPISGLNTGDRSGVNIVFVEVDAVGPTDRATLVGYRSIDSGTTFSPTGDRTDAPAGPVSDPVTGFEGIGQPALDAAFSSLTTTDPAWVATSWTDWRARNPARDIDCDARFMETPAAPRPDWQLPDELVTPTSGASEGESSLALQHQFGTTPTPTWLTWTDSRFQPYEILYRTGMLDTTASDVIDMTRFPIAPVRALDPTVSVNTQLTHCVFEPATFACNPTRTAGWGTASSVDANEFGVFVVWQDSRFGNSEIFFKRTDQFVSNQPPRLTASCDLVGGAFIDAEFDVVRSCPQPMAGERMQRYLVYYGTSQGGPFTNAASPIEILASAAPGPTFTQRITGLLPGTTYQVIVVPEDEARNVYPATFDPLVDGPNAHPNEASIATPTPCVAPQTCLWRSDVTALAPHAPPRAAVYLVPPASEDIALQGPAYRCPFGNGDLEPDANALFNGVALMLYQVNQPVATLRLAKSGTTIQFAF